MQSKRLFIFAAYDPAGDKVGIIDMSDVLYVKALAEIGDVIFYMDNDTTKDELDKVKPFVIFAGAQRAGEYDFGSYKRGYLMARAAGILQNYDFVYFVNSSVYAPLHPIRPLLEKLESQQTDAVGIVFNTNQKHPHIQSWFFGMRQNVFLSDWFTAFITGVTKLPGKGEVTRLYEHGFTRLLIEHNLSWTCAFNVKRHAVYNNIKQLFDQGLPFMKKVSFVRHHGSLGRQVLYILESIDSTLNAAILVNANRVYGESNVKQILTKNRFKIAYRRLRHSIYKIFIEGI